MSGTTERGYDVAVVGSGIIGLGVAFAAHARGQRVIVFDRGSEPTGASVRNFGHLCFTPQHGIARDFAFASRELWLTLAAEAGVWLRQSGTLVAARHDDELAVLDEFAAERNGEVELLTASEASARMPLAPGTAVGGAFLPLDLQVNPRQAVASIAAHLARHGVEFRYRTSVGSIRCGRVETSRGAVDAREIVVAANHDIDQLFPDLAEQHGIERCGLDMLRVSTTLRTPLAAPLLTGWSLVRYGGFAAMPTAGALRERLHTEDPALAALDLNQMYTQLPDGSLIVGDTHYRGTAIAPFQSEASFDALLAITRELFGVTDLRVLERWQGVYASGPNDFLIDQPEPGVSVLAATTGIGMTTGLGLADNLVAGLLGEGAISSTLKGTA
ncbi:TIGR03364 family FAD-dependent oxidoreductase [Leifsonia sp. Leaf264]|uniref:TIGR03364 family FAD-dependent oxidoreductase n=1 Tax=Leifsonia sp. Leaf264 TaxID=1736314 RepID=UPI0006F32487|nr:TIGR03364 family FAD-dependent oxidoreductase [Leifsonia sp. Leaf264]KQP01982.1 oxidoreductase [Leifsonia sp. Leaf264]